jgi:hypothetical protein
LPPYESFPKASTLEPSAIKDFLEIVYLAYANSFDWVKGGISGWHEVVNESFFNAIDECKRVNWATKKGAADLLTKVESQTVEYWRKRTQLAKQISIHAAIENSQIKKGMPFRLKIDVTNPSDQPYSYSVMSCPRKHGDEWRISNSSVEWARPYVCERNGPDLAEIPPKSHKTWEIELKPTKPSMGTLSFKATLGQNPPLTTPQIQVRISE